MKRKTAVLLQNIASFGLGFFLGGKALVNMINTYKNRMDRAHTNMMILNEWLEYVYSGGIIEKYFHTHEYTRVVVYGNGYIGRRLVQALSKTEIEVTAVMDKEISADGAGGMIGTDSTIPDSDCIIVTPIYYWDEIYSMLRKRTDIPIISIQTVINDA